MGSLVSQESESNHELKSHKQSLLEEIQEKQRNQKAQIVQGFEEEDEENELDRDSSELRNDELGPPKESLESRKLNPDQDSDEEGGSDLNDRVSE